MPSCSETYPKHRDSRNLTSSSASAESASARLPAVRGHHDGRRLPRAVPVPRSRPDRHGRGGHREAREGERRGIFQFIY